jgi:drug/metabolite transporter (DMT)-like permease
MQSSITPARFPPSLALVTGMLAVSCGSIFVRFSEAPPLVTAAWRMILATALLLPFAAWTARDELRRLARADLLAGALAGFFLALHFATWITSLSHTTVANSTVLVNSAPVWVALLGPWFTRDRVTPRAWLGIALSVAGGALMACEGGAGGGGSWYGDALALAGGLALAIYLLSGRKLRSRLSTTAYLTVCYSSAAIFLCAAVLATGQPFTGFTLNTWGALLGMALINQHLGHTSYNWAMRHFSAGFIAVCLLSEPVIGSLLAWRLFGEALTLLKVAGGALILTGIYLSASNRK